MVQLQHMSRRCDKNWRFLSALTDPILRSEGIALISLTVMASADMSNSMLCKSLLMADRIDQLMLDLMHQGRLDEQRERMLKRELDAIKHMISEFRRKNEDREDDAS